MTTQDYMHYVRERVKDEVAKSNLTQREIAARMGLETHGTLWYIMNGTPTLRTLHRLSQVLGFDIHDLLPPKKPPAEIVVAELDQDS